MYRYETHMHTMPASKCGKATVREQLEFYKSMGYAGVFVTNHFIDGNLAMDSTHPYEERVNFYFADFEEAQRIGKELDIAVFDGVEMSYKGTDFLVYGLHKDWYLQHPEIDGMKKTEELQLLMDAGAMIIQAHPYREANYIDHIRLFPRHVHGIEVLNATQSDFRNEMARIYADAYELVHFAGSDNHRAGGAKRLAGMECDTPLEDEQDFIRRFLNGSMRIFRIDLE